MLSSFHLIVVTIFALATTAALFVSAQQQQPVFSGYDPQLALDALWWTKISSCTDAESIRSWSCVPCQHYPNFKLQGVHTNKSLDDLIITGYEPDSNRIIISPQASEDFREWITDFTFKQVPAKDLWPDSPSDALVHEGFMLEWLSYATPVMNDVKYLLKMYPNAKEVLLAGHSLGASVCLEAALSILHYQDENGNSTSGRVPIKIYTFGEPRLGNPAFAAYAQQYFLSHGVQNFRVVHRMDPVPHLPPMDFAGTHWLHVPSELWYDNNGNTSYKVCYGNAQKGTEDKSCSDSVLPIDPMDHTLYLGISTGCGPADMKKEHSEKNKKLLRSEKWQRAAKMLRDHHVAEQKKMN